MTQAEGISESSNDEYPFDDYFSFDPPESAATEKAVPGTGRFQLEKLLGAGGVCQVFAAVDLHRIACGDTDSRVAVKRLLPGLAGNRQAQLTLGQEFGILRRLAHPGVLRAFDLHQEPFGICLSMELLEGPSVQEALSRHPAGLGASVPALAARLFDALDFLHGRGVAHGDIKPGNIFLEPDNRVVLIDFNVAAVTAAPGGSGSPQALDLYERRHLPSFSLLYAAPERLENGRPTAADDIFAACCSIYELTCGGHPFMRLSAQEAREQGQKAVPPIGLPAACRSLLLQGLSFDPAARPTAAELRDRFAAPRGVSFVSRLKTAFAL